MGLNRKKVTGDLNTLPVSTAECERGYIRFTVAEWLTHSPATLEVTGSRPTFGGISEIYF